MRQLALLFLLVSSVALAADPAKKVDPTAPAVESQETTQTATPPVEATKPAEETHASPIFAKFPHEKHNAIWPARELGCMSCHQFGAGGKVQFEGPLRPVCHQCHVPDAGEKRLGPGKCETCHSTPPVPPGHGAGWIEVHGSDARADMAICRQCHKAKICIDCHELKETVRWNVHDRSWVSIHGIAARTDPTSCDTCHARVDCTTCHADAGGRW